MFHRFSSPRFECSENYDAMMQKSNDVTMRKVLSFFALTIGVGL